MQPYFLIFGVIALVLLIGLAHFYRMTHGHSKLMSGFRPKTFMTNNEVDFFHKLKSACASDYVIFAQVSMGALLDTKIARENPKYWQIRASFSSKILDFVICDPTNLSPLLIVELDDKTHNFDKDKVRDSFTALGGYKTVRFWSKNKPTVAELRTSILGHCAH